MQSYTSECTLRFPFLSAKIQSRLFLKIGEILAWPFFGARQYCTLLLGLRMPGIGFSAPNKDVVSVLSIVCYFVKSWILPIHSSFPIYFWLLVVFMAAIMLGSLKMPFDEIRLRILRCDGGLEPESIQAIQKYLPPADKVCNLCLLVPCCVWCCMCRFHKLTGSFASSDFGRLQPATDSVELSLNTCDGKNGIEGLFGRAWSNSRRLHRVCRKKEMFMPLGHGIAFLTMNFTCSALFRG